MSCDLIGDAAAHSLSTSAAPRLRVERVKAANANNRIAPYTPKAATSAIPSSEPRVLPSSGAGRSFSTWKHVPAAGWQRTIPHKSQRKRERYAT
jgi:hypothetical protein